MTLKSFGREYKIFVGIGLFSLWLAAFSAAPGYGANVVVDHTNWDWYVSQTQVVTDAVSAQKIYFTHASVGGNILQGFSDLHASDASKYPLSQATAGDTPPGTTINGTIYEYNRGNPGWSAKISGFETCIQNGWHDPKVDMAMNKFCFIDQAASWTDYRDSMVTLEANHPGTKFIYWTMPLTTDSDSDAVLRAQFNQNLRNWIATQDGKLLYDLADIEAWSPGGAHQTFTFNTVDYEHMYTGYTTDGGHLNQAGYDRAATGLYSLFGMATTSLPPAPTATPGTPGATPAATPVATSGGTTVSTPSQELRAYPNPARTTVQFELPAGYAGTIEIRIYNLAGELIGELTNEAVAGTNTRVSWNVTELAAGIYLARVHAPGHEVKKLKIAVVH